MNRTMRTKGNRGGGRNTSRQRGSNSYLVAGMGGTGEIARIREPHPNDILCGRGGSINNHEGNKRFRDWVHERKNDYNLATNKAEKARVSREVMDLVQNQDPPGRFLTRDAGSSMMPGQTWWVEIDDAKAMAKTSQALREGAPAIRAQHKEELRDKKERGGGGGMRRTTPRRATSSSSAAAKPEKRQAVSEIMPPPPVVTMSNEMAVEALRTAAEAAKLGLGVPSADDGGIKRASLVSSIELQHEQPPKKKARIIESAAPETETPPLMPVAAEGPKPVISLSAISKVESLKRAHSLSLSDINGGDLEFVNPFEDEGEFGSLSKQHPAQYPLGSHGDSNHSVGHMSFTSLPKLSNSDLSRHRSRSNATNNNTGTTLQKTVSSRSMISELSDLPDPGSPMGNTDFNEGLKTVWAAVHPDLTSLTHDDEVSHTHLYPFKGASPITRRLSPNSKSRMFDGAKRQ